MMESPWYAATSLPHLAWVYLPQPLTLCVVAFGCVVLARGLYRFSLSAHAQFGELFKSVFDQYRSNLQFDDVVKDVGVMIGNPELKYRSARDKNMIVWRYLRWHRARDFETNKNLTMKEWEARRKGSESSN
jgi:hypothetical protein